MESKRQTGQKTGSPLHGRYTTYTNWSCRCAPCRLAWAEYSQKAKARRKRITEGGAA